MNVRLFDLASGELVKNHEPFFVRVCIYSSENPPKEIRLNTSGNKMVRGDEYIEVKDGRVSLNKLQIKEVSSHFRNGWLFLVVLPKSKSEVCGTDEDVNADDISKEIKPLIFDNVIVKAKIKSKRKYKKRAPKTYASSKSDKKIDNDEDCDKNDLVSDNIVEEINKLKESATHSCDEC